MENMTLSVLDYIIIALAAIGGIWGAIKGIIEEVSTKFGFVAGFLFALMFSKPVMPLFTDTLGLPVWLSAFISYFLIFIIGFLLVKLLGYILQTISDTVNLTAIDRILGFILGVAEAYVVIGLLETLLLHQSVFDFNALYAESVLSEKVVAPGFAYVTTFVQELF